MVLPMRGRAPGVASGCALPGVANFMKRTKQKSEVCCKCSSLESETVKSVAKGLLSGLFCAGRFSVGLLHLCLDMLGGVNSRSLEELSQALQLAAFVCPVRFSVGGLL